MILGIDLGTTNSLAALWMDGQARLVPNGIGGFLTPSCVGLDDDGTILVGEAARERLQTHPERTASLFKRHMGSDKVFRLGARDFRAEELSSLVLRALKADAEAMLGAAITEAIISVPAYFSDAQRKATRIAGQLAGLRVDRLINEPTAAALAYGLHQTEEATQFLVFDLGGGTFDVSILELFENVMEVRATAGDNALGGEDFVAGIVKHFIDQAGVPAEVRDQPAFVQRLTARAELAKRALSEASTAEIEITWAETRYALTLTEDTYARIIEPLLARLREPVTRALRDARINSDDIATVVLAGGATRSPLVRTLVTRMFGRFPSATMNPDEVVAAGAAVMAGLKMKDAALDEFVMTDVCPYTLGIESGRELPAGSISTGHFSPVIDRNTVVPVSRSQRYAALREGQKEVEINIYQGESRLVRDNIRLGQLTVPVPPTRAQSAFDVRFTYDVNGLLEVEATVLSTGQRHRLVIQGNSGVLSEAEIAERLAVLAKLKIHPREQARNRALLARADRIYQQLRLNERALLDNEITRFEHELESQDEHRIRAATKQLEAALQYFEHSNPLAPER